MLPNADNFRRHLKAMEFFRLSHHPLPADGASAEHHTPLHPAGGRQDTGNNFTDENGRVIVIPIWNVELPGGSQN